MENFKKWGFLKKAWVKYTNRPAYRAYKEQKHEAERYAYMARMEQAFIEKYKDFNASFAHLSTAKPAAPCSFKHAGNAGDIVYALPIVKALAQGTPSPFYMHLGQAGLYHHEHPLGNVMLNQKMMEMLAPLLEEQSYISKVEAYTNQAIDYDLDIFRQSPMLLNRGDISRWYMHIFNVFPDLSEAWLAVPPDTSYSDCIVLARSQRYNNPLLDYSILKEYPRLVFVGVEKEYQLMREVLPNLAFQPVQNFLELARVIAGSKLFIGNQSFPFSLAEGLKVRRILEVFYECPNVLVHGKGAHDIYFQYNFAPLVRRLYEGD